MDGLSGNFRRTFLLQGCALSIRFSSKKLIQFLALFLLMPWWRRRELNPQPTGLNTVV